MKITKSQLRKVIKEEIEKTLQEITPGSMRVKGLKLDPDIAKKIGMRGPKDRLFKFALRFYDVAGGRAYYGPDGGENTTDSQVAAEYEAVLKRTFMEGSKELANAKLSAEEADTLINYLKNSPESSGSNPNEDAQKVKSYLNTGK